jgi:hypothetical protein
VAAGERPKTMTRRRTGVVAMAALSLLLAGCSAHTTGATNVAGTFATLNASGDCSGSSDPCSWYWRWGHHGAGYPSRSATYGPVPVGWSGSASYTATGLDPATAYDFQLCGWAGSQTPTCVGPDGTANTYGQFTTTNSWYQSLPTGARIATDPVAGARTTSVGAGYLGSQVYKLQRNGVDAGPDSDKCTTNGTGPMNNWATDIGTSASLTGLSVPSDYEITTSTADTRSPLCQANGSKWGFYMDMHDAPDTGVPPPDPPDPSQDCYSAYCNMQHSVDFDTCNNGAFNCRPWSASDFGGGTQVLLASNYYPYKDCTKANGCSANYHAYMCLWLQDASQTPHPKLEYCVETWRNSPSSPAESVVAGAGGLVTSWTRAADSGTAYATKCTGTAVCGPFSSSNTLTNNTLGNRTYAVTISRGQLARVAGDINSKLHDPNPNGPVPHFSTDPSDYELTGIEDGNEGGYTPDGYLGSNVSGLTVQTVR